MFHIRQQQQAMQEHEKTLEIHVTSDEGASDITSCVYESSTSDDIRKQDESRDSSAVAKEKPLEKSARTERQSTGCKCSDLLMSFHFHT